MVAIIPPPPKPHGIVKFTASGLFTVPPGVRTVYVSGCGGGSNGIIGAPGFAGQAAVKTPVSVTPGESIPVTVGSAGATGSASSFGSYLTIAGAPAAVVTGFQNASQPMPAPGQSGPFGVGGAPATSSAAPGGNASGYGAGGGAGYMAGTGFSGWAGSQGGNGSNGVIIVEY